MLSAIEWIIGLFTGASYGNTPGFRFRLGNWSIVTLGEKYWHGKPYTEAERHAVEFLSGVKEYLDFVDPQEKWHRPYGDELIERRNLH